MASTPILGCIYMFAGNFAPSGYALCDGRTLSIAQNTALFSILGTTYGGNGTTNYNLPDLRSRVPLGSGQGTNLSFYSEGQQGGFEQITLGVQNMPQHNHLVNASSAAGSVASPSGNFPAVAAVPGGTVTTSHPPPEFPVSTVSGVTANVYDTSANVQMSGNAISFAGSSQPHENRQPFTCILFIIALTGIFPSRN